MFAWRQLVYLTDAELSRCDIAAVNLACAAGLPDAAGINVTLIGERLDWFARVVRQETERKLPRFRRKRYDYRNSEAYFRILALTTVLQRDCGVRYNLAKIPEDVPLDTADIFVHGAVVGSGGTCASLPVVYAAVGRRLGYPFKLVTTTTRQWGHLFVRWDEPGGKSFNIETTSWGLNSDPDDYYRTGVYEITPEEERKGNFLKSLTPREELASFLAERGFRWLDYGRYRKGVEAMAWASALAPANLLLRTRLKTTMKEWEIAERRQAPRDFPQVQVRAPERRFPSALPREIEDHILTLEATENLLRDAEFEQRWWGPMRAGHRPARAPVRALTDFTPEGSSRVCFQYPEPITYSMESRCEN